MQPESDETAAVRHFKHKLQAEPTVVKRKKIAKTALDSITELQNIRTEIQKIKIDFEERRLNFEQTTKIKELEIEKEKLEIEREKIFVPRKNA